MCPPAPFATQRSVRVRLFARLRDLMKADSVVVQFGEQGTAAELKMRLIEQFPTAESLVRCSIIACDMSMIADAAVISGDEVALIPPVSGG